MIGKTALFKRGSAAEDINQQQLEESKQPKHSQHDGRFMRGMYKCFLANRTWDKPNPLMTVLSLRRRRLRVLSRHRSRRQMNHQG